MQDTLRRTRDERAAGDRGFTLIELLVVVVIIGVLVAIAIPVYLNYREGAADKAAQSDVRGAILTIEQEFTETSSYPATLPTDVKVSDGTTLVYESNTDTYVVCAENDGGDDKVFFHNSRTGGSVKEHPSAATPAACLAAES